MPVYKLKRRNGTKATHRAPIWLSSREYRALLAKMYLLEQQVDAIKGFLSGMIQSMQAATKDESNPPADSAQYSEVQDPKTWDGSTMPVTVRAEEASSHAVG